MVLKSALSELDSYELPSIVGEPAQPRPASSSSTELMTFDSAVTQSVIRELVYKKAFVNGGNGAVEMNDLYQYSAVEIEKMVMSGILASSRTIFGEPAVALNTDMIQWGVLVLLSEPCQHIRLQSQHKNMQRSKLDIILQLRSHGWREAADQDLEIWKPGQPLLYIAGMRQPLSYFVCLLQHGAITSKGVPEIKHRQLDGYYKCLLSLPAGAELDKVLAEMDHKPNKWFLANIKDNETAAEEIGGEGQPHDEQAALEDVAEHAEAEHASAACSLLFSQVKSDGFSRQLVDVGSQTPQAKVYFDHFSGSGPESHKQRGFIACAEHCCIRYRQVEETDSLLDFCCRAYIWHIKANNFTDKQNHLAYEPSDDEVVELRDHIRLIPF